MIRAVNPAVAAFARQIADELIVAQVLILRQSEGFELRHALDRDRPGHELKTMRLEEIRALAQQTGKGAFRPLKSAPNLARGWRMDARGEMELGEALDRLYPGAIADWHAVERGTASPTHYREFTGRQTGMYRVTTKLGDEEGADAIRACCDARFCLKRRLWTIEGLSPDAAESKSLIPCLEPCAVMLEFARQAARIEQAGQDPAAVLSGGGAGAGGEEKGGCVPREADFSAPDNPRRMLYVELRSRRMRQE